MRAGSSFVVGALALLAACTDEVGFAPLPAEVKGAKTAILYRTPDAVGEIYDLSQRSLPRIFEIPPTGETPQVVFYSCAPLLLGLEGSELNPGGVSCLPGRGRALELVGSGLEWHWDSIELSPAPVCTGCGTVWLEVLAEAQVPLTNDGRLFDGSWLGPDSLILAAYGDESQVWRVSRDGRVDRVVLDPPLSGDLSALLARGDTIDVWGTLPSRGTIAEGSPPVLHRTDLQLNGHVRTTLHLAELADGSALGIDGGGNLYTETPDGYLLTKTRPEIGPTGLMTITSYDIAELPAGNVLGSALIAGTASISELDERADNYKLEVLTRHPGGERVPAYGAESIATLNGHPYMLTEGGSIFRIRDDGLAEMEWLPPRQLSVKKMRAVGDYLLVFQSSGEILIRDVEAQETCTPDAYRPPAAPMPYQGIGASAFALSRGDEIVLVHRMGRIVFTRLFDRRPACSF